MAIKVFCDYCEEEITEERPDVFRSILNVPDTVPLFVQEVVGPTVRQVMCSECFKAKMRTGDIRFTVAVE